MGKRKRRVDDACGEHPNKIHIVTTDHREVKHTILSQYYIRVVTLRTFLLSRLPASSRVRRRKIRDLPAVSHNGKVAFLDSTLVGVLQDPKPALEESRRHEFLNFTQSPERSTGSLSTAKSAAHIIEVSAGVTCPDFCLGVTSHG